MVVALPEQYRHSKIQMILSHYIKTEIEKVFEMVLVMYLKFVNMAEFKQCKIHKKNKEE